MNLLNLQMEIPCKWRVQSYSKNKPSAQCVAYIDARQVASILDEVVGAGNWQVDYKTVNDLLFAGIGIKIEGEWIWKWDTGSETQVEKDKGHVSDSFKRAGVQWGIGRFLYDMEIQYVKANEVKNKTNFPYPVDINGERIWDLTKHINRLNAPVQKNNKVAPQGQNTVNNVQSNQDDKPWLNLYTRDGKKIPESFELVSRVVANGAETAKQVATELSKTYKLSKAVYAEIDKIVNEPVVQVQDDDINLEEIPFD